MTEESLLRSHETWAESVRNFQWLHEAVSGAMDVDLMVERKGHFLFIEAKPWQDGVVMPYGQHKALYALSKQHNTRVYLIGEGKDHLHVVCYNTAPAPVYLRGKRCSYFPPDRFIPTTKDALADMVNAWWKDADASAN